MTFADAKRHLYAAGFAHLGLPARYIEPGRPEVATRAKVDRGMVAIGEFAQASQGTTLIALPRTDVPAPRAGASVVVEGEGMFTVERRQSDNGSKVVVSASEVPA